MSDRAGETENEIRRYLLGAASATEQADLEERFMTNEDYFQSVELAEEGLLDDYVFGRLSQSERSSFESHYLSTPERVQRLETARTVKKIVVDDYAFSVQSPSRTTSPVAVRWVAIAAGAVVCILGVFVTAKLRESAARQRQWEDALATKEAIIKNLEQQLRRAGGASGETGSDGTPVIVAMLRPDMTLRGNSGPNKVQSLLVPKTSDVQLNLLLTPDEDVQPTVYRAILKTVGGRQMWTAADLLPTPPGRRTISLKLPRGLLDPGRYRLELFATMRNGEAEQVERYSFSVDQN